MKCIDQQSGDNWTAYQGDCVEVVSGLPDESIGFSVYSPPFASLYTYSNSERDMGNCKSDDEFFAHYGFLISELLRVTKPGRLSSVHCMNLPTSKARDGFIGIRDFRGEIIRAHIKAGWIFHSEVVIWKDPVTAMQRTKALGLLHKQIVKDSCMSRQGIPDYVCTFRKPGENPEPVAGELTKWVGDDSFQSEGNMSIDLWQKYASPIWDDIRPSRTLQKESARESKDERHICPLQLDVIERCMMLWSRKGDVVLSPFMGIGSEGFVAVQEGRKFVGAELKASYFKQACANLHAAQKQETLDLGLAEPVVPVVEPSQHPWRPADDDETDPIEYRIFHHVESTGVFLEWLGSQLEFEGYSPQYAKDTIDRLVANGCIVKGTKEGMTTIELAKQTNPK